MTIKTIGNGYLLSEEEITPEEYQDIKKFITGEHRTRYDGTEVFIRKEGNDIIKTIIEA